MSVLQACPTGLGKLQSVVRVTGQGCLIGETSEDMSPEFGAAGLVSDSKGLDQVALGKSVVTVVVGHPTDEVELFRSGFVERAASCRGGIVGAK